MRTVMLALAAATAAIASPAAAQNFSFSYGLNGVEIASGTIYTDGPGPAFRQGSLNVINVTGQRNGQTITGFQNFFDVDQGDQLVFPDRPSGYVSSAGLTYQIGDYSYNITSPTAESGGGPNGLYTEFSYLTSDAFGPQNSQLVGSFTLTPLAVGAVPEAATWALMILGFGVAGAAMRRRRHLESSIRFQTVRA